MNAESTKATEASVPASVFHLTRWTLVLRAQGESSEARAALSELCEAYYQPVFRFLCRERRHEDAARELTQEFFARLLARGSINAAPERGRFRSYLLGAVKNFLATERDFAQRQKRGAGVTPESLDAHEDDAVATQVADPAAAPDDAQFDREWALALMERALSCVEREFSAQGKAEQFRTLKPWLVGDTELLPQAETAARIGMNETAFKVAIHRLRKRFREIIRAEIAQTVNAPAEVEAELRYLVEVLARR